MAMITLADPTLAPSYAADLPSAESFLSLVQQCRETKELIPSQRLHLQTCASGLETLQPFGNYLVPMLVDCGSLLVALQVFHRTVSPNECAWTSLIQGHVDSGRADVALGMLEPMQMHAIAPTTHTCVALLKACSHLKSFDRGLEVHHMILVYGLESHSFVCNTLVDMFCKCVAFTEATHVFDRLIERDIVSWTALIAVYAEEGCAAEAVQCLNRMAVDQISPNSQTFVCCLNACEKEDDFDIPQEIHMGIIKYGFDENILIGNALIHTYCKYGLIMEAMCVFGKLQQKDVVTWTALIIGQSQHGHAEEALLSLEQMSAEAVSPNAITCIGGFRACAILQAGDRGLELHSIVIKLNLGEELSLVNAMMDMYAVCNLLKEAQMVFNGMVTRNTNTWNIMIGQFTELGLGEEAQIYFTLMQAEGMVAPDDSTFILCLQACGLIKSIERGFDIHSLVVKVGADADAFVGGAVVDMYAKCHMLVEAECTLVQTGMFNSVSWTALIMGYTELGQGEDALKSLHRMCVGGLSLDNTALACGLKACSMGGAIDDVQDLHSKIYLFGLENDYLLVGSLVNTYCDWGMILEARFIFETSVTHDTTSWNSLITGYTKLGLVEDALNLLEKMQDSEDVLLDVATYVCGLKACAIGRTMSTARVLHSEVVKRGNEKVSSVRNSLTNTYVKCAAFKDAKSLVGDVVSWTSLIAGYWESGLDGEAMQCLDEMQVEGVSPDAVTFVSCLKLCVSAQSLYQGQQLHAEVVKEGFETDVVIISKLAELYSQCNLPFDAEDVSCLNASKP